MLLASVGLVAFAYFCGALPFGYWAGRLHGIDIRQHGSKNIGATNVLRVLGKKVGIPVFLLDALKGAVPTMLAEWWMTNRAGADSGTATLVAVLCAAAAVLGHTFTFWLGFKGGKGVATTAGSLLGLAPLALVIGLIAWLITFYFSRYVALASIVAAVVLPITMAALMTVRGTWNYVLLGFGIVMGVLVIVRHRSNIARMLAGTENRFAKKKPELK
jgi:glycerol-3-phosphate acyltransferase PlsY